MRVCRDARELTDAFETVQRLGQNNFSDAGVFLEKYIERARHLEVQIFGDGRARSSPSGCATARYSGAIKKRSKRLRAPNLPTATAEALCAAAVALGKAVSYRSAGRSNLSMTARRNASIFSR